MVSDEHYEQCLPILRDPELQDEDKTDKIEELFRRETSLDGSALENAILDVLWRHREGSASTSPPPIRHTILRRPSPASWRGNSTPLCGSPRLGVSPLALPSYISTSFPRSARSVNVSPFSSPRPSPRLAFSTPVIPNSPSLNAYEFANDSAPSTETFNEYQTENVEWLVADDAVSLSSSVGTTNSLLNASAPEFSSLASQQNNMTPYDMLRSILGQSRTDEEIESALASHGYDLSATVVSIMESQASAVDSSDEPRTVLVGRAINSEHRPSTPNNQKSGVICKFFLSTGQCLRADCRFSHDLSNHLCKYWVVGNCLAGDTCIFSHDPAQLMSRLTLDGNNTPPTAANTKGQGGSITIQDFSSFPSLQPGTPDSMASGNGYRRSFTPPASLRHIHGSDSPRNRSRPGSRHQQPKEQAPALDDTEAFPSLGASVKQSKKPINKRPGNKDGYTPSLLADVVKMAPSPAPSPRPEKKTQARIAVQGSRENSAAAQAIAAPRHIPWLETGDRANKAYLKARQEAIKHGGLRNKFLQSAAQAWNRNDARAAKALSLRGQSENELMKKAHREAARELYEERNKSLTMSSEIYVDLHGLHADEAVSYLEDILLESVNESRPIYAITGTGHHSKNGKDKVGKAIRAFLNEWRYAFREFSVPGDRNNMGGILGIDARSWDKTLSRENASSVLDRAKSQSDIPSQDVEIGEGNVRMLVRAESPRGPTKATQCA
ncbi:Polyadenylate-binding protein-interacting protein 7 [Ceratocystis fimbriata CBS 114723]|uniref:Polyadenylate-binding protein-interacting protein 7 n=1 Tax=Ceratocystis fimbriata CBS 114723 TaxID=1035309 RepID=A0A2C5WYZ2_9PEZI|nr:Polyadenylate-binding protein-interacting protein 7 [Ceratocystis fimbriata CBS 114723]